MIFERARDGEIDWEEAHGGWPHSRYRRRWAWLAGMMMALAACAGGSQVTLSDAAAIACKGQAAANLATDAAIALGNQKAAELSAATSAYLGLLCKW